MHGALHTVTVPKKEHKVFNRATQHLLRRSEEIIVLYCVVLCKDMRRQQCFDTVQGVGKMKSTNTFHRQNVHQITFLQYTVHAHQTTSTNIFHQQNIQ